jgi:hypothetical protein
MSRRGEQISNAMAHQPAADDPDFLLFLLVHVRLDFWGTAMNFGR